jgi:hypothetical protein
MKFSSFFYVMDFPTKINIQCYISHDEKKLLTLFPLMRCPFSGALEPPEVLSKG